MGVESIGHTTLNRWAGMIYQSDVLPTSMDLVCRECHSYFFQNVEVPSSWSSLVPQLTIRKNRQTTHLQVFSPCKLLKSRRNKAKRYLIDLDCKKPHTYCSCPLVRAWKKPSENFYGDDDDTLFEPTHASALSFPESVGLTSASKVSSTDTFPLTNLHWLLWFLGPCILLMTGVIPTLWLPFEQLFEGSSTAGLLALAGLDGIFNLGASLFLLMTDACARPWRGFVNNVTGQLPLGYRMWTIFVHMVGFVAPILAYAASKRGLLGPEPAILAFSAMIAPYSALLVVHTLGELLIWQWQSPVWAVLPVIYDFYSVLQLSRGLQLGKALGAPLWSIEAVKGLIAWWVFVLAVQLMWTSWFLGSSQN